MRVLHIFKNYYPVLGGIENHIKLLCEELAKDSRFQVQVLVTNANLLSKKEHINGVEVIRAGRLFEFASTPVSLSLLKWSKTLRPDLIHLHFPYPPGDLAYLMSKSSTKLVITYHADIVRQKLLFRIFSPLLNRSLEKAEAIIATSPGYAHSSELLAKFIDKVVIIPYGIELQVFTGFNQQRVNEIRKKYGTRTILFVGRLRAYKGLSVLLEVMPRLSANLLIIGDGPEKQDLAGVIQQRGLQNKVHLLGEAEGPELANYYHATDVFVLPSISESFGITLLEAMAAKKPVISTKLGTGTTFANQAGVTGLTVPPGDPDAIEKALNVLLENRVLRETMGEAGYQRVCSQFSSELMVDSIKKIYLG